ncbi:hypothetical protein WJX81_001054 [Elliptochloris bilobata]|uniref:Glutathione S-transferase n=1 Tax=Elliptochloris bilobata TaxID=381761 RepID=A0AAW1SKM0_9CHLO
MEPVVGSKLTFLSAWFCPFAQRTWIVLNEKLVDFQLAEVALKDPKTGLWHQLENKPDWFVRLNPLGKVPVLAHKDASGTVRSVYESLICNEYLEECHPRLAMLPSDPVARAHARIIIDRFNSKFVPVFYRFLIRQEAAGQEECAGQLRSELAWLDSQVHERGPYFAGQEFSLVDAAIIPWFTRMPVLQHYRSFHLPDKLTRLAGWAQRAARRQSVLDSETVPPGAEDYSAALLQHYSRYADASANSTSARDFK